MSSFQNNGLVPPIFGQVSATANKYAFARDIACATLLPVMINLFGGDCRLFKFLITNYCRIFSWYKTTNLHKEAGT